LIPEPRYIVETKSNAIELIREKEAKHGSLFETTLSFVSEKYRSAKSG